MRVQYLVNRFSIFAHILHNTSIITTIQEKGVIYMFYIGCPMWGYKEWVGSLFPLHTPQREFLRLYSQRLSAVEGNTALMEFQTFLLKVNPQRELVRPALVVLHTEYVQDGLV